MQKQQKKMIKLLLGLCFLAWTYADHEAGKSNLCIYHDTKYTCDCARTDENIILPPLSGHVFHISISNCKSIQIPTEFLVNTQGLRSMTFNNIESLVLQQRALSFPQLLSSTRLILEFNNVTIKEIQSHVFNGNIDEIAFTSSKIDVIRPFAFTSMGAYFIRFTDTMIGSVEPQAFKKFSLDQLEFTNSVFLTNLPSKSFYDIEIKDFLKISNTAFRTIYSMAFTSTLVSKMILSYNRFERLDGECFNISIGESVIIKNNTFGWTHPAAFRAISQSEEYYTRRSEKMDMRFTDNSIKQQNGPVALEFNKMFQLTPKNLYYLDDFDCQQSNKLNLNNNNNFFQSYSDTIYLKMKGSDSYTSVSDIVKQKCNYKNYWVYIGSGIAALILLALIILGIVIYLYMKKKKKQKLDVVMPEPRTYRETQIVLQIENAGLLKTDM